MTRPTVNSSNPWFPISTGVINSETIELHPFDIRSLRPFDPSKPSPIPSYSKTTSME